MKILHINSLGYEAGGVETGILALKKVHIENVQEVRILSSNISNGSKLFSNYTFKYPNSNIFLKIFLKLFNPFSYFKLRGILLEFQPDIVHIHRMDYLSPSILMLLKKYPTIMTIHSPEEFIKSTLVWFMPHTYFRDADNISVSNLNVMGKFHYFFHTVIQKRLYDRGLKNIDQFITPSKYFTNLIKTEIYPVSTLHNGVELGKFKSKKELNYSILYAGRLDKFKGIDYLIAAMPKIIESIPNARLTLIGEGIYKEELMKLINKLGLNKNIFIKKWMEKDNLFKAYSNADLFIIPSIWPESFGKTGLEAMSTGTPVIGTNVGGIPEWLIHGVNGYLVEPKNSDQLAEAIIKLFKDPDLLKKMRLNARKQAELFSINKNADSYVKLYKKYIKKQ